MREISAIVLTAVIGLACAKPPPVFEEIAPADVLYADALKVMEGRRWVSWLPLVDYTLAVESFQAIIDNYPYSDYAVLAELKIADAYFQDAAYDEALSYYRDFGDLHPAHEKVPYTILQSALCRERQVQTANRDQTATRDALHYLDRLLSKYPHSAEATDGERLWRELRTRLAENVTQIAEYYLNLEEYESAAERYRSLLNEYPGLGLDAQALYNLAVCYSAMRRIDEADRIFHSIVQNYRNSEYAQEAATMISQGSQIE